MENGKRDLIDVSLWCRLCSKNIGELKEIDPHEHKARRYRAGYELHVEFMQHQMTAEHMKRRREEGLTD